MTYEFKWIPEAPSFRGYYAAKVPCPIGKLGVQEELGTYIIHDAHQFDTREECEAWIAQNSPPEWVATQHGFYTKGEAK